MTVPVHALWLQTWEDQWTTMEQSLCILVALRLLTIPPFSAFNVITFFIFHNQHTQSFTNL